MSLGVWGLCCKIGEGSTLLCDECGRYLHTRRRVGRNDMSSSSENQVPLYYGFYPLLLTCSV